MGPPKEQRLEAVLRAVASGLNTSKAIQDLPEYQGYKDSSRRTMINMDLESLVKDNRLWFRVGAGIGSPRVFGVTKMPDPEPTPTEPAVYVPPPPIPEPENRTWTLEELLYWLVSSEEKPEDCLVARSFEKNRQRAVEAVRVAIDQRDTLLKRE